MRVTFYGVRGSCPCSSGKMLKYGGNTSCVVLSSASEPPLILDLGTGLRRWAHAELHNGDFFANALLTHAHWDHVQGLAFFPPIDKPGAVLNIFGPTSEGHSLTDVFGGFIRPPYFPITLADLHGQINLKDIDPGELALSGFHVAAAAVPHKGRTFGYRITDHASTVAYISDHQAPASLSGIDETVLDLCRGADLLIHDAQYSAEEFERKSDWGHSTATYATDVALRAGVKRLALFHHDPDHSDDEIDALLEQARRRAGDDLVVMAAAEGQCLDLG